MDAAWWLFIWEICCFPRATESWLAFISLDPFPPATIFHFIQQSNGIEQIVKWTEALEQNCSYAWTCHHCFHKLQLCKILQVVLNSCNSDMSYGHFGALHEVFLVTKLCQTEGHRGKEPASSGSGFIESCSTRAEVCEQEQGSHTTPGTSRQTMGTTDTLLQGSGT